MDSGKLKEKGNTFIKEGKYQDALQCYTAGLEIDSSNHALLSNRSLANFRLHKFKEALADAEKCIKLAPTFGRGYLRKCTVLNSLGCYIEAMHFAEEGYKLRQSDTVCKECVSQWLVANQVLHQDYAKHQNIPTGCLVLSDKIGEVIKKVTLLRRSVVGISWQLMKRCMLDVAKEMERLLDKFGHKTTTCVKEWIHSLTLSFLVDPQTDTIPKLATDIIIKKGNELTEWLSSDIDPILYPVVLPIVAVFVLIVVKRAQVLSAMNVSHNEMEFLCKSVLPLFRILSTTKYIYLHIDTLHGVLRSFHGRRKGLTTTDVQVIHSTSKDMRILLEKLPSTREADDMKSSCFITLALVEQNADIVPTGGVCVTANVKMAVEKIFEGKTPSEIMAVTSQLIEAIGKKPPLTLTTEDAEYLLFSSYALAGIGQNQSAVTAFHQVESLYVNVFEQKMTLGEWSLDEMGSILASPRNMMFDVASKLAPTDSELLVNTIIRWKCLHTEFVSLLLNSGSELASIYKKTYAKIFNPHKSVDYLTILQAAGEHREEENKVVQSYGPTVLKMLFKQSHQLIQSSLQKDEVVLDYCYLNATIKDGEATEIYYCVLIVRPDAKPVTCMFEYYQVPRLGNKLWEILATDGEMSVQAISLSRQLCDILFPLQVREIIESDQVKHVFLCPDLQISNVPWDLLVFSDNKMLIQKCSISVLSSSREILRCKYNCHFSHSAESTQKQPIRDQRRDITEPATDHEKAFKQENTEKEAEPQAAEIDSPLLHTPSVTSSQSKNTQLTLNSQCVIFANPNFNLERQSESGVVSDFFQSVFSFLFRGHTKIGTVEPLPCTEEEADVIEHFFLTKSHLPFAVQKMMGDNATIKAALAVQSPRILHFATHGFCLQSNVQDDSYENYFGGNFWASTSSGLLLSGANTYSSEKYGCILEDAGTGQLTSTAVCGMDLKSTRLVYLSACSSSSGLASARESHVSLAQTFRAAGAQSVIATRWPVADRASKIFATHFYNALMVLGTRPSEALVSAKNAMRQDTEFGSWVHWLPYVCIGYDFPLLPKN